MIRKKMVKPTKKEHAERVDICRQLLCAHQTDGAIKKAVAARYDIHVRSVQRYLARARQILLDEIDKTPDEMRSQSYETYRKIIADPESKTSDVIQAQKHLDKLFGLNGPIKVAQTDAEGNDLAPGSYSEARLEVGEIITAIRDRQRAGPPPSNNGANPGQVGEPSEN